MNAETAPPHTPFEALGGKPVIEQIVNRFYDLMDSDPAYAELRAMHAPDLAPMRRSLAGWLTAWAGGPNDWFEQNPGKCVMSAHRGLGVTKATARQWINAMGRAIAAAELENQMLANELENRLTMMAAAMTRD
tara:strand:+ start:215 stop:613 length:399 start_codon:yes stop_codon:yes gene_type:complete